MVLLDLLDQLDSRQQKLAAASSVLLLSAALLSYVLLPQIRAYRQALGTQAVLEAASVQGDLVELQLQGLGTEVQMLQRQLHGDMVNLPEEQLEAFVIGRLQSISWRDNVELISIEPKTGDTVHMFSELLFNVSLTGHYTDLYTWLNDIKSELGFIVIKEYRMRPIEDVARDPELAVSLTIATYRLDAS